MPVPPRVLAIFDMSYITYYMYINFKLCTKGTNGIQWWFAQANTPSFNWVIQNTMNRKKTNTSKSYWSSGHLIISFMVAVSWLDTFISQYFFGSMSSCKRQSSVDLHLPALPCISFSDRPSYLCQVWRISKYSMNITHYGMWWFQMNTIRYNVWWNAS